MSEIQRLSDLSVILLSKHLLQTVHLNMQLEKHQQLVPIMLQVALHQFKDNIVLLI